MSRFSAFKVEAADLSDKPQFEDKSLYLGVGVHNVKIVEVTEAGPDTKDPSWLVYSITMQGAGNKTTKERLLVPTSSKLYVDSKGTWPLRKLVAFINGVLPNVTAENMPKALEKLFGSTKNLEDVALEVTIKHTQHYAKYISKDCFHLMSPKDVPVMGNDGVTPRAFATRDEAQLAAVQAGLKFYGFPNITAYGTPQSNPKLSGKPVVKKAPVVEETEEDPFA